MYSKIQITGTVEVMTGMHIGGSSAYAAIGAVDSPVIRDIRSGLPMIPGSSLKGKMRTLLAKEYNENVVEPDNDDARLTRLFGSAKKGAVRPSRILISDMLMINEEELRKQGLDSITEIKFENSINRMTAVANPRQIERAIRGSKFGMDIMYEAVCTDDVIEDMRIFAEGLKLLQYDYIGGNGSRGYGKIKFRDVVAKTVVGDIPDTKIEEINNLISEALTA